MKKIIIAAGAIILGLLSVCTVNASAGAEAVIDTERLCSLYIDYKEDTEGTEAIENAQFTAYRIALFNSNGGYDMLCDLPDITGSEGEAEELLKAACKVYKEDNQSLLRYDAVTGSRGEAIFAGMECGLYVIEESRPAKEHFASAPFVISLPYTEGSTWRYIGYASPKSRPAGKLAISKTLHSMKDDSEREFHFKIELEGVKEAVHFTTDTTEGYIRPGESIALKGGERAVLDMLPVGCAYKVTEEEADQDGYITTWSDNEGHIMRKQICEAAFTNSMLPPPMGDSYMALVSGGISIAAIAMFAAIMIYLRKQKEQNR